MNHAAQITFLQDTRLFNRAGEILPGRWDGTLLNTQAIDRHTGQPVGPARQHSSARPYTCRIVGPSILTDEGTTNLVVDPRTNQGSVRYTLTTQGPHVGSRRHRTFRTLAEAQAAAAAWAGRRFYVQGR